ncbi:MAG: hypothetical protein J7647_06770 [Cyanobacteria bacterium SBLK]|nr:hypothetical protein [Cyanobacteria bacterium SBLK]
MGDRHDLGNALHDELQECGEKVRQYIENPKTTTASDRLSKISPIDFLIVTALAEERDAVPAKPIDDRPDSPSSKKLSIIQREYKKISP